MSDEFERLKQEDAYLKADGFDGALIGFVWPLDTGAKVAVYDRNKCLEILQESDGMTEEEAIEYFEFNVTNAYLGEQTPMYLDRRGA